MHFIILYTLLACCTHALSLFEVVKGEEICWCCFCFL